MQFLHSSSPRFLNSQDRMLIVSNSVTRTLVGLSLIVNICVHEGKFTPVNIYSKKPSLGVYPGLRNWFIVSSIKHKIYLFGKYYCSWIYFGFTSVTTQVPVSIHIQKRIYYFFLENK